MSEPTTTNAVATLVNKALSTSLKVEEGALETAIIAQVPWLGLPVIKQVMEAALGYIEGLIYQNVAISATKIIIDFQTDYEASATQKAFDNATKAVASGDQSKITAASAALDAAFASAIHYDGSTSP